MRVLLYFNNRYLYGDELCHLHYYHIILTNTNGVCALQLFNDAGQHIDDISEPPNPYTPPSNYCYIRPFIDTDYVETWMPHMIEFLEHHNIISTLAPADQKPYYCEIIRDTKTGDRLPHMLQGFLYSELVRVNDPAEWTAEIYPFTRRIEPHCPTTPEHGGLGFHADGRPVQVDRHLWLSMQTIDPPKRLLSRSERYLNHYTERMKEARRKARQEEVKNNNAHQTTGGSTANTETLSPPFRMAMTQDELDEIADLQDSTWSNQH